MFVEKLIKLTGTVFQVLLMNRSLLDDWLMRELMLQLLGTAGTAGRMLGLTKKFNVSHCKVQGHEWGI